ARAPVVGSGCAPAWIANVAKPGRRSLMAGPRLAGTGRSADPVVGLSKRCDASRLRQPARVANHMQHSRCLLSGVVGLLRADGRIGRTDRLRDIGEPSVDLAPQELLTGEPGIDRDHAIAALEQILEGEIARPAGIGGYPDHRDGLYGIEDAADVLVVVTVVVHTGATFGSNIGAHSLLRKVALVCLPAFRLRRRCEAIMRAIAP